MNRITATALYLALTAWPGLFAHAQPLSTLRTVPYQTQRAEPVIQCTNNDGQTHPLQACSVPQAGDALRLGSTITRQELECFLSGLCGMADRARFNGWFERIGERE